MKIKNTNKIYNTDKIREFIKLVKPSGISNFAVTIQNTRDNHFYGKAFCSGKWLGLRIGKCKLPAITYKPKNSGYLKIQLFTQDEILIYVLAHELRHLWQAKHKRGYRYYNAKSQFSERDCDCYALHKLRQFRRGEL